MALPANGAISDFADEAELAELFLKDTRLLLEKTKDALQDETSLNNAYEHRRMIRGNEAIIAGISYCLCSCSMILLNKLALSGFNFGAGVSFMCFQNLVCVSIVYALKACGYITTEPLTLKLVIIWLPVNIIFVGMLISSILGLKYMNIAMLTITKNTSNIITAVGELYFFNRRHNSKVWTSLLLMVISAVCGGITDMSFNGIGYTWQVINCFLTAAYSLVLRRVMDVAKGATKSGNLNEYSMVLLNNALSLPFGLLLAWMFNEMEYLSTSTAVRLPMFWFVTVVSGFVGLGISFTSMWFLHQTGPTTYSLVGSLNKIPIAIAGILLFGVPTSFTNLLSITFGLFAGVMFARAKM